MYMRQSNSKPGKSQGMKPRNFRERVNSVKISRDMRVSLQAVEGRLRVSYDPFSNEADIQVVDKDNGKTIGTYEDLVAIGGHRKFLKAAVEKSELLKIQENKMKMLASAKEAYEEKTGKKAGKMIEKNWVRFCSNKVVKETIEKNTAALKELPDDQMYKKEILRMMKTVESIINAEMIDCIGDVVVNGEGRKSALMKGLVPLWLYKKAISKSMLGPGVEKFEDFLYPRNFSKSFSLTTAEIHDEEFMNYVTKVFDLKTNYFEIIKKIVSHKESIPDFDVKESEEKLQARVSEFQWNLPSARSASDLLKDKVEKKSFTTNKGVMDFGGAQTDSSRVNKYMSILSTFNHTWNAITRFQPDIPNAVEQYWSILLPNVDWEVSATCGIYDCIAKANPITELEDLLEMEGRSFDLMVKIFSNKLGVIADCSKLIEHAFKPKAEEKVEAKKSVASNESDPGNKPVVHAAQVELKPAMMVSQFDKKEIEKLVSLKVGDKKKKARGMAIGAMLTKEDLKLLKGVKDESLKDDIKEWAKVSFPTSGKFRNFGIQCVLASLDNESYMDMDSDHESLEDSDVSSV